VVENQIYIFLKKMTDSQIRNFSAALARLSYPVQLPIMDPLVVQCQSLVLQSRTLAQDAVGVIESLVLRAPAPVKLPLVYFLDAILRSNSPATPILGSMITPKIEDLFCIAYNDSDAFGQEKMLKMLNIWQNGMPGRPPLFPAEIVARIRARVDPNYTGPHISELPTYKAPPSFQPPAPVPFPAQPAAPPQYPPFYGYAPPAPHPSTAIPSSFAAGAHTDHIFARANELLQIFLRQLGAPHGMITLPQLQIMDPVLFGNMMNQAALEMTDAMRFNPMMMAGGTSLPQVSSSSLGGPTSAPPPGVQFPRSNTPIVDFLVTLVEGLVLVDYNQLKALHTAKIAAIKDTSTTRVRCWYSGLDDWVHNKAVAPFKTVSLFEERPSSDATSLTSDLDGEKFAVPKDESQTSCALSGVPFKTFWSDETQQWMYASAIRPDPNGPIYNIHAWNSEQGAKRVKLV